MDNRAEPRSKRVYRHTQKDVWSIQACTRRRVLSGLHNSGMAGEGGIDGLDEQIKSKEVHAVSMRHSASVHPTCGGGVQGSYCMTLIEHFVRGHVVLARARSLLHAWHLLNSQHPGQDFTNGHLHVFSFIIGINPSELPRSPLSIWPGPLSPLRLRLPGKPEGLDPEAGRLEVDDEPAFPPSTLTDREKSEGSFQDDGEGHRAWDGGDFWWDGGRDGGASAGGGRTDVRIGDLQEVFGRAIYKNQEDVVPSHDTGQSGWGGLGDMEEGGQQGTEDGSRRRGGGGGGGGGGEEDAVEGRKEERNPDHSALTPHALKEPCPKQDGRSCKPSSLSPNLRRKRCRLSPLATPLATSPSRHLTPGIPAPMLDLRASTGGAMAYLEPSPPSLLPQPHMQSKSPPPCRAVPPPSRHAQGGTAGRAGRGQEEESRGPRERKEGQEEEEGERKVEGFGEAGGPAGGRGGREPQEVETEIYAGGREGKGRWAQNNRLPSPEANAVMARCGIFWSLPTEEEGGREGACLEVVCDKSFAAIFLTEEELRIDMAEKGWGVDVPWESIIAPESLPTYYEGLIESGFCVPPGQVGCSRKVLKMLGKADFDVRSLEDNRATGNAEGAQPARKRLRRVLLPEEHEAFITTYVSENGRHWAFTLDVIPLLSGEDEDEDEETKPDEQDVLLGVRDLHMPPVTRFLNSRGCLGDFEGVDMDMSSNISSLPTSPMVGPEDREDVAFK